MTGGPAAASGDCFHVFKGDVACVQQDYCKLLYKQLFSKKSTFAAAWRAVHDSVQQSIATRLPSLSADGKDVVIGP